MSVLTPSPWRQLARRTLARTLPSRLLLTHGPASSGAVGLTFDDGPHPVETPRLLDVLKTLDIVATFFVVGREAERYPDLVRRIAAEGHAVGHHSWTHGEPATTSAAELGDEVWRTRALLAVLLKSAATLFRPPKGSLTAAKLWNLWRARQTVVLWNVDPKDYRGPCGTDVAGRLTAVAPRPGDLVLLHDNHPYAADVLPEYAARVRAAGLRFARVSEWVR